MSSIYEFALAALSYQPSGGFELRQAQAKQLLERLEDIEQPINVEQLRPLLKLIAVLEKRDNCQGAAEELIEVLRRSPRAFALLRTSKTKRQDHPRVARSRLSSFEGRTIRRNAPTYDAPRPQGTLSGHELMRTIDSAEVKAKK